MKKINSRQYAQTFWEITQGKTKSEIDKLAKNFILLLQKNNDLKIAKEILANLAKTINQATKRLMVTVISPKPLSPTEQNFISEKIKAKTDYKEVVIENQIEPALIAGWQLKIGWQKFDTSLRTKLNNLKTNLE